MARLWPAPGQSCSTHGSTHAVLKRIRDEVVEIRGDDLADQVKDEKQKPDDKEVKANLQTTEEEHQAEKKKRRKRKRASSETS